MWRGENRENVAKEKKEREMGRYKKKTQSRESNRDS